ncbi:unnamed protein product, partial [Citrullus colocynthis]
MSLGCGSVGTEEASERRGLARALLLDCGSIDIEGVSKIMGVSASERRRVGLVCNVSFLGNLSWFSLGKDGLLASGLGESSGVHKPPHRSRLFRVSSGHDESRLKCKWFFLFCALKFDELLYTPPKMVGDVVVVEPLEEVLKGKVEMPTITLMENGLIIFQFNKA